jgi:DNA-binding MarR family transcriptional regulator
MQNTRHTDLKELVKQVRAFNRFYTHQIGLLNEGLYGSRFSLTQMRVLREVWLRKETTATAIRRELGLDAGYLSRMLKRFEVVRLIRRRRSKMDGRESHVSLTVHGLRVFLPFETQANTEIERMLKKLSPFGRQRLARAMGTLSKILHEGEDS